MNPTMIMRPQALRMLGRPARLHPEIRNGVRFNFVTANRQSTRMTQNRFLSSSRDSLAKSKTTQGTLGGDSSRVSSRRTQAAWQRLRDVLFRRNFSSRSRLNSAEASKSAKDDTSLSARMKKLSREYGWAAMGVYLGLSVLDYPFFFLLVKYVGAERIGEWEHAISSKLAVMIPPAIQEKFREVKNAIKSRFFKSDGDADEDGDGEKGNASLATQLALAYAVHKSFIFVRVPLTVAVTPKVVKVLRSWGWDIGKRTSKAQKAANRAEFAAKAKK